MSSNAPSKEQARLPWLAGLLSLILPGAGQIYARQKYRGLVILISEILAILIVVWYGVPAWYAVPTLVWLWNIWDAISVANGRPRSTLLPIIAVLVMSYVIGWKVTNIDPSVLTQNIDRAATILGPMLRPDFFARVEITNEGWAPVEVPCGPNPPVASNTVNGITVNVTPNCGSLSDNLTLQASGLWPDTQTLIQWATPIGDRLPLGPRFSTPLYVTSDANGNLEAAIQVSPNSLNAAPDRTLPLEHRVYFNPVPTATWYQAL